MRKHLFLPIMPMKGPPSNFSREFGKIAVQAWQITADFGGYASRSSQIRLAARFALGPSCRLNLCLKVVEIPQPAAFHSTMTLVFNNIS